MITSMIKFDFTLLVRALIKSISTSFTLYPPWGRIPYLDSYSKTESITKAAWDAASWNPPPIEVIESVFGINSDYTGTDTRFDCLQIKPTWEEVIEYGFGNTRREKHSILYDTCRDRIQGVYGGKDLHHEIHKRRAVRDTTKPLPTKMGRMKNNESISYKKRYHVIKNYINSTSDSTLLEAFDPLADSNWMLGAPWSRPDGVTPATIGAADLEEFNLTSFEVINEMSLRMTDVEDADTFNTQTAQVLQLITKKGWRSQNWNDTERTSVVAWNLVADKMSLLERKAEVLNALETVPIDYQDDKYWTADSTPTFGSAAISDKSFIVNAEIVEFTLPEATGGNGELVYSMRGLPEGLAFDSETRIVSGTPTMAQTVSVAFHVTDSDLNTAVGDTAEILFSIVINS